jgi:hypothetical protein
VIDIVTDPAQYPAAGLTIDTIPASLAEGVYSSAPISGVEELLGCPSISVVT